MMLILFQKDSMNFALYSSNWTEQSLNYRKLLLYAMRMNTADNLNLRFSMQGIVNLEMFANVCIILFFNKNCCIQNSSLH